MQRHEQPHHAHALQLERLMQEKMRTLSSAEFERVLHPVFEGLSTGKPLFGVFLKDYVETEW